MRWLFYPSQRLMGRLPYAAKFILVGLILGIPLVLVNATYVRVSQAQLAPRAQERVGLRYIVPVIDLTSDAVLARQQAVGFGGSVDLRRSIQRVDQVNAQLGGTLDAAAGWATARRLLVEAQAATTPADAFSRYNGAATALLRLVNHVGDQSRLTLDPDLDTFSLAYAVKLHLPLILDTAGRISDRADLARQPTNPDVIQALLELAPAQGALQSSLGDLDLEIGTALTTTSDTIVKEQLRPRLRALDTAANRLIGQLQMATLSRDPRSVPVDAGGPVRDAAGRLAQAAAAQLDRLLAGRIDSSAQQRTVIEVISLIGGIIALYLFSGFYLSVVTPLRRIVAALHGVAAGDLDQTVSVDTHDELRYVATVLNTTIAKTKAATDGLAHQATHDPLTRLPTRDLVLDRLDHALRRQARGGGATAVLFLDLDGFKAVNDSLGHGAGDVILTAVAERLTMMLRGSDTVGRLAGDEFVIVCEECGGDTAAVALAHRLSAAIRTPILVTVNGAEREAAVDVSIGVAIAIAGPEQPATAVELIRYADMAMYAAKHAGPGGVRLFDAALRSAGERRLKLRSELGWAIDHDQLRLHYQPIVATASRQLTGFEALVRWQHPLHGLLAPGEFVPLAEETGLVVKLGDWALATACRQLAAWRISSPATHHLSMAVNVSVCQLTDLALVDAVKRALDSSGLSPGDLHLEITETAVSTEEEVIEQTLTELRGLGVHIAMDDFGAGYSSLARVRAYQVDALKIDRSLVEGVAFSASDRSLVVMALQLGSSLHLDVVAEGVETMEQLSELSRLGCPKVQGFLLGAPLPAAAVLAAFVAPSSLPADQRRLGKAGNQGTAA